MLHFFQRAADTVANAALGKLRLFADTDGFYKVKNSAGVVTLLGNGIKQILKTDTVGLVDTYTITLDDNTTRQFIVTNGADGRSIVSIERTAGTGAPGTTDTYTITYTKAPLTTTFMVYNGADGATYTDEMAQDAAALMLTAAAHVGISVSYDDANNRLVITNTGVTQFNGRTGNVTPEQADYDAFFTTPAEASAAAPVQSVNGLIGQVQIPTPISGVVTLDFGPFPGKTDTAAVVTGLTTIQATSYVDVKISPADTPDHMLDEQWVDPPLLYSANIVSGVGFTVVGRAADPYRLYGKYTVGYQFT